MDALSLAVAGTGVALLVIAAIGLFRLPDALSRQHAATKSVTLALGLLLFGVALQADDRRWWWRVGIIVLLLLVTLPVASHMLARAAARQLHDEEKLRRAPRVGARR